VLPLPNSLRTVIAPRIISVRRLVMGQTQARAAKLARALPAHLGEGAEDRFLLSRNGRCRFIFGFREEVSLGFRPVPKGARTSVRRASRSGPGRPLSVPCASACARSCGLKSALRFGMLRPSPYLHVAFLGKFERVADHVETTHLPASRTSSSINPRGNFGSISANNATPFSPALIEKKSLDFLDQSCDRHRLVLQLQLARFRFWTSRECH